MAPKTINKQRNLFLYILILQPKRCDISFNNIVMTQLWVSVFTKIKSSDV